MRTSRLWPVFKSAAWRVPLLFFGLALVVFLINAWAIVAFGSIDRWVTWFQRHRLHFLLWRLLLYGVTAYAWLPLRRRIVTAEAGSATAARLLRAEVAAVIAVVLIEALTFLQSP